MVRVGGDVCTRGTLCSLPEAVDAMLVLGEVRNLCILGLTRYIFIYIYIYIYICVYIQI